MRRFLLFFAAMFLNLSIAAGSVAHAMEPLSCIDNETAQSMGHSAGDSDQVPADADNGRPHHHGSCHSHQMADRISDPGIVAWVGGEVRIPDAEPMILPASAAAPTLRPPIA